MGIIESEADAIAWAHQMAKTPTTGDHEVTDPHPYCLGDDPCCCVQLIAACETARADERDKAAERVRVETLREALYSPVTRYDAHLNAFQRMVRNLPTPTLPPSSRQRGTVTAKAVHDRRISSADETDLRDDGGTTTQ